ncbi:hypothetical protein FDECE_6180 [Fusarium decemcellulare]|nr:hypothetical protein FDECE_6180 [Fusarium decemcellulare]
MAIYSVLSSQALEAVMSFRVCGIITACILAIAILVSEVRAYRRLAHVPGPRRLALTNLFMASKQAQGLSCQEFYSLMKKYGPLVRIGPNQVITSDPSTIKKMSAARSAYTRTPSYKLLKLDPVQDNILSILDDAHHKALKSKMGPGYSGRENGGFEPSIDKHVASFVNLIETEYLSTADKFRPIDLGTKTSYFTLDVISELGFGASFGFLKENKDLHHFAAGFVDSRLEAGSNPGKDMMQSFVNQGLSRGELMQEVFVETVAGADTTAAAIRATFLGLLGNPSALAKLHREIEHGVVSGDISSPITDSEAQRMPYLQAVIRESLRMWPPAAGTNPRLVPPGGDNLLGYDLPAGTYVSQDIVGVMHRVDIFGPDAGVFNPDRWIEAEALPERLKHMRDTVELVFSHGKYMCLGKTIARMELNKVFVELLRRFDFSVVNSERPAKLVPSAIMFLDDFWVWVSKRQDSM